TTRGPAPPSMRTGHPLSSNPMLDHLWLRPKRRAMFDRATMFRLAALLVLGAGYSTGASALEQVSQVCGVCLHGAFECPTEQTADQLCNQHCGSGATSEYCAYPGSSFNPCSSEDYWI